MTKTEQLALLKDHGAEIYYMVCELNRLADLDLESGNPIRAQVRKLYDYLYSNDYNILYSEKYGAKPRLCFKGVTIPKEFMNPYAPGEVLFCVIDGKIAREATDKEQEVIDWCFGRYDTPEISEIGYALFENEPIMREWIDKASKYYLQSIKGKYKKWKTKKTFWLEELESME